MGKEIRFWVRSTSLLVDILYNVKNQFQGGDGLPHPNQSKEVKVYRIRDLGVLKDPTDSKKRV